MDFDQFRFGIYEKALPDSMTWRDRLLGAREAGYDFLEISIDETDERLTRLDWNREQKADLIQASREAGIQIRSICLSAHRRFPIGSSDMETRNTGMDIMFKAIDFAADLDISIIQTAGYDCRVDEDRTDETRSNFHENLVRSVTYAAERRITLALENIGPSLVSSVEKAMEYVNELNSPNLQVYPDFGNLDAVDLDVDSELRAGRGHFVGIHVKDTREDVIRRIPFGEGRVDFHSAFETIRDIAYRGPLLVEMWADNRPDALAETREARLWILDKMKEVWGT